MLWVDEPDCPRAIAVEPDCPGAIAVATAKVGLTLPELSDKESVFELPAVDGGPKGSVIVVVVRRCVPLTTLPVVRKLKARCKQMKKCSQPYG